MLSVLQSFEPFLRVRVDSDPIRVTAKPASPGWGVEGEGGEIIFRDEAPVGKI